MFSHSLYACCLLAIAAAAPITHSNLAARNGPGSVVTSPTGLQFYSSGIANSTSGNADPATYNCFSGPASSFPSFSSWINFADMFNINKAANLSPADSSAEASALNNAILSVSADAKVDARVILAIILQESTGNVRVPCTNNGVVNCGLMQSHNPADTSYDPNNMQASITQMVVDGTQGTASGPGLVQLFNDDPSTGVTTGGNPYNAFRAYNSGKIDASNLNNPLGATASYVSDVANRLQGWNGSTGGKAKCGF